MAEPQREPPTVAWRPAALIVNTRSRKGKHLFRAAREELLRAGVNVTAFFPVKSVKQMLKAVRSVLDNSIEIVVVGGGDGTVASVADALAYHRVVLGVLPLGTGNDFARTLGIPLDLQEACRVIAEGHVEAIDLACVNGRHFVNTTMVGFPAYLNHRVPNWLKRLFGQAAYYVVGLYGFLFIRSFRATITVDGVKQTLVTPVVLVGNGRFHVPTQEQLPSGAGDTARLIIQAPRDLSRVALVRLAFEYARSRRLNPAHLLSMSGGEVVVEAEPAQEVDVDGEAGGSSPVQATMAAGALKVLRPKPEDIERPLPESGLAA
jgi:diacylglycerol kinase (ATP)